MNTLRRLAREPLVHFFLIGAALFVVDRARTPDIVATLAVKRELERELSDARGRAPTGQELEAALQRWRRDEALYREGLRQGLDRDDVQVRARVIDKVLAVEKARFVPPRPSAQELDAWLEENRARYEIPPRYDFEHVFAARDRARAEALKNQLASGAAPDELGERFADGRAFVAQSRERVVRTFGARFAGELATLPPGSWTPLESEHGWHVVRLQRVEGGLPPRELLGERLIRDFRAAALDEALARYTKRIEGNYTFREER